MGTDVFLASMSLPASCEVGKTIFKKQFYDHAGLSTTDKKLITNNIQKVIWQYCLKPETINIQPYSDKECEFSELQVIEARLREKARHQRVAEIIMRSIPYPMILQLTYGENLMIVAGMPRINLADQERHTIEEFVYSPWIDSSQLSQLDQDFLISIQARNLSYRNFFRFYSNFMDKLHLYNAATMAGRKLQKVDPQEAHRWSTEIKSIERDLVSLRAQFQKEFMFNRKVDLNVQIRQLEEKKVRILAELE